MPFGSSTPASSAHALHARAIEDYIAAKLEFRDIPPARHEKLRAHFVGKIGVMPPWQLTLLFHETRNPIIIASEEYIKKTEGKNVVAVYYSKDKKLLEGDLIPAKSILMNARYIDSDPFAFDHEFGHGLDHELAEPERHFASDSHAARKAYQAWRDIRDLEEGGTLVAVSPDGTRKPVQKIAAGVRNSSEHLKLYPNKGNHPREVVAEIISKYNAIYAHPDNQSLSSAERMAHIDRALGEAYPHFYSEYVHPAIIKPIMARAARIEERLQMQATKSPVFARGPWDYRRIDGERDIPAMDVTSWDLQEIARFMFHLTTRAGLLSPKLEFVDIYQHGEWGDAASTQALYLTLPRHADVTRFEAEAAELMAGAYLLKDKDPVRRFRMAAHDTIANRDAHLDGLNRPPPPDPSGWPKKIMKLFGLS